MADVFISYSKTRAVQAEDLAAELGELGYQVWWDTSLLPTGSFGAEIDRQLDAARAVIVIWSPESVRSKWVRSEAAHADRQEKLVNTHTADFDPARQMPKPFDQIHSVGIDNIRAIVAALDALQVPRSGGRTTTASVAQPASVADADDRLFAEVEKAGTAKAYGHYLGELPKGRHALVARFRLKALRSAARKPSPGGRGFLGGPFAGSSPSRPSAAGEGRIKVDAKIIHGAPDGRFKPGAGKTEWFKDLDIGPEMVVVPGGSFTMGSSYESEKPPHKVRIKAPFAVGRFAVTFDEWDAANLAHKPGDQHWGRGRRPVINVSWEDAKAYASWLSQRTGTAYRLLSEAEWEYCCRAGTTTKYAFGVSITRQQAQFRAAQTVEVGKFPPNAWGLYDTHGNVWEWVEDAWHPDYRGAPEDGLVWPGGNGAPRVVRGGSWSCSPPLFLHSAGRLENPPADRNPSVGFRVARAL